MHYKRKNKIFLFISRISKKTLLLMNCLLFPLTVTFLHMGISFYIDAQVDLLGAIYRYSTIFEYLLTALVIVFAGATLFDISLKELEK